MYLCVDVSYMYINLCMCLAVYASVFICVKCVCIVYIYVYLCLYVCMYLCIYLCLYVYLCLCMYLGILICICVCIYALSMDVSVSKSIYISGYTFVSMFVSRVSVYLYGYVYLAFREPLEGTKSIGLHVAPHAASLFFHYLKLLTELFVSVMVFPVEVS